ncbi:MAG: hypothetical protein Q8N81_03950 [bacterium]|nr:hypothetical protein [bacterium]
MPSHKCSACQKDPGYTECPACHGIGSAHCDTCHSRGKIKCPACDGHGYTGEFAGTTLV